MSRPELTSRLRAAVHEHPLLAEALQTHLRQQNNTAYLRRTIRELQLELRRLKEGPPTTTRITVEPTPPHGQAKWKATFLAHLKQPGDAIVIAHDILPRFAHHSLAASARSLGIKIQKKRLMTGLKVTRIA